MLRAITVKFKGDHREFIWFILALATLISFLFFFYVFVIEAKNNDSDRLAFVIDVSDNGELWAGVVTKIKISNIKVPNADKPKCKQEQLAAQRIITTLMQIIPKGSFIMLRDFKQNENEVFARVISPNGFDVGDMLISHGLAKSLLSKENWCESEEKEKENGSSRQVG